MNIKPATLNHKLYRFISEDKLKKIINYKVMNSKKQSFYGELFLKYILIKNFNFKFSEIKFSFNNYGKPYLTNNNIYFNISHSKNFVIIAVSDKEVGVDIENINTTIPIDMKIFHLEEQINFLNLNEEKTRSLFFNLWTAKESYVKFIGKGLSIPFNQFYVDIFTNYIYVNNQKQSCNIKNLFLSDRYASYVCSKNNSIDKYEEVNYKDLISFFGL